MIEQDRVSRFRIETRIAIDGASGDRLRNGYRYLLDSANWPELSECGDAVVESNLFDGLAVL
jgi:hypothetical protein